MTCASTSQAASRLRALIDHVAADQGVPCATLVGPSRRADYARTRFAVVWLGRTAFGASWAELGRQLGGRDPATIIHAHRRAETLRGSDPAFHATTDRLLAAVVARSEANA